MGEGEKKTRRRLKDIDSKEYGQQNARDESVYGPESFDSDYGFWSRDEVFDNLKSLGWDRPEDEKLLIAFWKICNVDYEAYCLMNVLSDKEAKTDRQRLQIMENILTYYRESEIDLGDLSEEVKLVEDTIAKTRAQVELNADDKDRANEAKEAKETSKQAESAGPAKNTFDVEIPATVGTKPVPPMSEDYYWFRDDEYENMEANGWNRPGDEKIRECIWKICVLDPDFSYYSDNLSGVKVTTDRERMEKLEGLLKYAEDNKIDLTGYEEEVQLIKDTIKPVREQVDIENQKLEEERKKLEEERLKQEEERKKQAEEDRRKKEEERRKKLEKEEEEREKEKKRREEREKRRKEEEEDERLWKQYSEAGGIYLGYEDWQRQKAMMLAEERKVIDPEEKKRREELIEEEARKREEEERLAKEAEEKAAEEERKARIEAARKEAQERLQKDLKYEAQRTEKVRLFFEKMVKLGLDEYDPGGVDIAWATKAETQQIDPNEFEGVSEEEWMSDPEKYRKRDNLLIAHKYLDQALVVLKSPENKAFYDALKGNGDWKTEYLNLRGMIGLKNIIEMGDDEFQERMAVLDKLGEMKVKSARDICKDANLQDEFWVTNGQGRVTAQDIKALKNKVKAITDKGMPWEEYEDSGAYHVFASEKKYDTRRVNHPLAVVDLVLSGPVGEEAFMLKGSQTDFRHVMTALDGIEKDLDEKKPEHITDVGSWMLGNWLDLNGYDLIENSFLVKNGVDEKIIDGEKVKVINMNGEMDLSKINLDNYSYEEYQQLIKDAKEVKAFYRENKSVFEETFNLFWRARHGMGVMLKDVEKEMNAIDSNPALLEKLNRFRHMLYKVKLQDELTCRLENSRKEAVYVKALNEDVVFSDGVITQECDILDTCYDMLKAGADSVKWNSGEYKSIMSSIRKLQENLRKYQNDPEKAKKTYIKAVNTVLNNINRYRVHKANDGVNVHDGTRNKLIAMERVDQLLRTRYRSLEQREYEDSIGAVADLFAVEVEDKNAMGDDRVMAKALSKINNMHKKIEDFRAELRQEEAQVKRRNTISGIRPRSPFEEEEIKVPEQKAPKQKAQVENAPAEKENGMLPEQKQQQTVQEMIDEKNAQVEGKLKESALYEKLVGTEEKFRASLDLKDENDKQRLVSSAEKTLYMESVLKACVQKGSEEAVKANDVQKVDEELAYSNFDSGMKALNKSGIKARAFMAEHLTNKDFNTEFRNRVLKGAGEKKTGREDIIRFRDEALKACYSKKGPDVRGLDKISKLLGSKVNSTSVKKELEAAKKTQAQKAQVKDKAMKK